MVAPAEFPPIIYETPEESVQRLLGLLVETEREIVALRNKRRLIEIDLKNARDRMAKD